MSNSAPPPNWYSDPRVAGQLRYWDGAKWTDHTAPAPRAPAPPSGTPTRARGPQGRVQPGVGGGPSIWFARNKVLTGLLAVPIVVVIVVIGSAANGSSSDVTTTGDRTSETEKQLEYDATESSDEPTALAEPEPIDTDDDGVDDENDVRPKDPKVQTEDDIDTDKDGVADYKDAFPQDARYARDSDGDTVADALDAFPQDDRYSTDDDGDGVANSVDAFPGDPSRSEITLAMENALQSAQEYLDFSAFSRLGLIQQLSSSYGEGYKLADATWAVDQLRVDWKDEAVESARQYLDFSSFSREGLIQQLSSSAGEKFTYEEAVYAVNKLGL